MVVFAVISWLCRRNTRGKIRRAAHPAASLEA